MIYIKTNDSDLVEVKIQGVLETDDFKEHLTVVDKIIQKHGHARLLLDAADFSGWEDTKAAESHFHFIKEHQQHVEKIALIAGQKWQHWVASAANIFVHPDIKVFEAGQWDEARAWIKN